MNIGVFDTGTGGRLVANRLEKLLPHFSYTVVDDRLNAPYGTKSEEEIFRLTDIAIQPLLVAVDIIVLACNTVTTTVIDRLRLTYPSMVFIGIEPMIKPAALLSKTQHITLLATVTTKQSIRTTQLIDEFAPNLTIDFPDTADWATAIDQGQADNITLSDVAKSINSGSDTIILGCTHYLALEDRLRDQFPSCQILEPSLAIAKRITQLAKATTAEIN